MCGIAGIVELDPTPEGDYAIRAMVDAIAHRGPNGQGIETWPHARLGHRRLSIIDLSESGHQPMLSEDRRIGVVFNGCIYNFLEIRSELEQSGYRFRSNCDTEVLVHGYRQWGVEALVRRLRGMFAFAVWDNDAGTLALVRDRLGVKPLVYAVDGDRLAFASTIPALRAAGFGHDVDPAAVLEYLEFGYVTDDRTIFQGIRKLPAAHIVQWHNGNIKEQRYWELPEPDERSRIGFEEAVEETERLLIESVRLRLYADVPVGALLSGGIDSTLVCWAMAKSNANIKAFTVSTPNDACDEGPATEETARILGIPHEIVTLPREQEGMLDQLTAAYGEPFGCQSALAMLRVSAAVKPHATVLLTGDGGDDVFLGYSFQQDYWRAQRVARALPSVSGPLWRSVRPLVHVIPPLRRPKHFLDYATGGLGAVSRAHNGLPFFWQRNMLGERLAGLELPHRQIPLSTSSARNLLPEFLKYQQRMWFVAEFMTKVDGATMHHALEARSPFLDQRLWEFAAKLPPDIRLRGGVLKALLREIVSRRISPAIAARKKQGFTIPVERWLLSHWSEALDGVADQSLLEREGWIRPGALQECIAETKVNQSVPTQLWFLVVLEHWLRKNKGQDALASQRLPATASL